MYRDIPEEMRALIEPIVDEHGLELVDADLKRGRAPWTLRVIVDTPEGDGLVPVEDCARVSREIGSHLDARDLKRESQQGATGDESLHDPLLARQSTCIRPPMRYEG